MTAATAEGAGVQPTTLMAATAATRIATLCFIHIAISLVVESGLLPAQHLAFGRPNGI